MTRKPHGAEEEQAHGPKTFGHPEAYARDDRRPPYEDTHEGHLSSSGGSSGSGGGGEQILDTAQREQELDQTQRARPPRLYPSSVEPVPDEMAPGQLEPGEPLLPGGKDAIEEPEAKTPGARWSSPRSPSPCGAKESQRGEAGIAATPTAPSVESCAESSLRTGWLDAWLREQPSHHCMLHLRRKTA